MVTLWLPITIFAIVLLFPFYWMILTALKPHGELTNYKSHNPLWVFHPTLSGFRDLFSSSNFPHWLVTSVMACLIATAISVVVSVMAAYGIQVIGFRGSRLAGNMVFLAYIVPPAILFIPLSTLIVRMGVFDTRWALVIGYPTLLIPFCTWLLLGFFSSIPRELVEAALMDGAGRLGVLVRIVLPLAGPGVISAAIFSFTLSWNDFLYSLTFVSSSDNKTIPVGALTELVSGDVYHWQPLMAAALLGSVPVVLVYALFGRYYVAGLAGAIKE